MKHLSTFESHNNDDIINRIGELDKKLNSREFEVKTKFSFTKEELVEIEDIFLDFSEDNDYFFKKMPDRGGYYRVDPDVLDQYNIDFGKDRIEDNTDGGVVIMFRKCSDEDSKKDWILTFQDLSISIDIAIGFRSDDAESKLKNKKFRLINNIKSQFIPRINKLSYEVKIINDDYMYRYVSDLYNYYLISINITR